MSFQAFPRRCVRALAVLFSAAIVLVPSAARAAEQPGFHVPEGYRVVSSKTLGKGLRHIVLQRSNPDETLNVAVLAHGAPFDVRTVLSNDAVAGPEPHIERTSSMCARVHCAIAVNGDFFSPDGAPIGAAVVDGMPVHSPNDKHHELTIDNGGTMETGQVTWNAKLVPTDLHAIEITGVNVPRSTGATVLYTPEFGPSTGTNPFGVELTLQLVEQRTALQMNHTALVRMVALRAGGDSPIPAGGLVLSGHGQGASALTALWTKAHTGVVSQNALLRIEESDPVAQAIGGTPILVRDGRRWVGDDGSTLIHGTHPRTIAGWTATGEFLLVTVDGRQRGYSIGMNLVQAADTMISMGATDAINLDGGGSSTFVTEGVVSNRPSDRLVWRNGKQVIVHTPQRGDVLLGNLERPVANALVIVPEAGTVLASEGSDPLTTKTLALPRLLALPSPSISDPASDPGTAGLPAVVLAVQQPPSQGARHALITTDMLLIALVAAGVARLRRPRRRPS